MMNAMIKVYSGSKYSADSKKVAEVEYTDILSYEVKIIEDDEIYEMGFDDVDDYKEYLILTFANGETSTFKNSHVDMFRI